MIERKEQPKLWRVWWHSHVNFDTYFSPTDLKTARNFLPDETPWRISIVGNKRHQFRVRYDEYDERHPIAIDNLSLEVAFGLDPQTIEHARRDIETHVRKEVPKGKEKKPEGGGKKEKEVVELEVDIGPPAIELPSPPPAEEEQSSRDESPTSKPETSQAKP